jgi:hypothetical protein
MALLPQSVLQWLEHHGLSEKVTLVESLLALDDIDSVKDLEFVQDHDLPRCGAIALRRFRAALDL